MLFDVPEAAVAAVRDLLAERRRQDTKWGADRNLEPMLWLTVLTEEVGEVARGVLERDAENLREELVQVAAVAIAWVECHDRNGGMVERST